MHHLDVGIGSMTAGMCEEQPHHDVLSEKKKARGGPEGEVSLVVWFWGGGFEVGGGRESERGVEGKREGNGLHLSHVPGLHIFVRRVGGRLSGGKSYNRNL